MAKAVPAPASQPEATTRPPARFATRGHNSAASRVAQLIAGVPPHALLIVGPRGVGAGTLARDVAATLLCSTPQSGGACGECRACRLVLAESHADLARITPSGAADEIGITPIRELETSLALLPVEGGRRVALIEHADRMSEPAQNALLKTLEEPPLQTHIILAAAEDSSLLPTIRSRCAVIRLGLPEAAAASELIATRLGLDAATATRLLRMAGGRPGPIIDAEASGDAARAHAALRRQILDFVGIAPHARLRQLPALIADASAILAVSTTDGEEGTTEDGGESEGADSAAERAAASSTKSPTRRAGGRPTPAERRANAKALLHLWRGVARDLALVASSAPASVAFPEDLHELTPVAARCAQTTWRDALISLDRALAALRRNGNPELLLDAIALRWPRG
ncbi:MAG: DNA polymerase III subunit delta' [Candidatus Limnocylindrus sp.]